MARTCPNCGYRPIGPFTDNCPMCAEPVRNVRSDRAGFGGPSSLVKWLIIGGVVAVLGVGGCCGLGMWKFGTAIRDAQEGFERMQAEHEAERLARPVVVAAGDLVAAFRSSP